MGFQAKFGGTCASCHNPIEPGHDINTFGMTGSSQVPRYEHADCRPHLDVTCSICGDKWATCGCP